MHHDSPLRVGYSELRRRKAGEKGGGMGKKVCAQGDHGSVGTRVTIEIGTGRRLARFARRLRSRGVTHLTGVVVEVETDPGGSKWAVVELDDE